MRSIIFTFSLLLFSISIFGQMEPLNHSHESLDKLEANIRIGAELWQLGRLAKSDPLLALTRAVGNQMTARASDQKVYVRLQKGWDASIDISREEVEQMGFEVQNVYKHTAGVWVDLKDIEQLNEAIPGGFIMRGENLFSNDHEGITATNAFDYQANGSLGQGVNIAVIDGTWLNLGVAQAAGTAPANPTLVDFSGSGQPFASGSTPHGSGCTEIIFEYAPSANYTLYKIAGVSQLGIAVADAVARGIDLISCSTSYFNTGWADNSGLACSAASLADANGVIYFHGSGNFNLRHYQGSFFSTDGDNWHNYASTDEQNNVTVNPGSSITVHLQWAETPSVNNDYDLYLFNSANNNQLAVSNTTTDYESITWSNTTAAAVSVGISVNRFQSSNTNFEVFVPTSGLVTQYNQTGGSTASPANTTDPLVITVGVVNQTNYNNTNPPLETFCSTGPTNSGATVPDLCAPDNVTLATYPNGFSGASAGGPNTCGLAAVLWSEHSYLSAEGVLEVLYGLADLYNDWGDAGWDTSYGRGGIELNDWQNNTRFIMKNAGNTTGTNDLPYADIEMANDFCPSGKTLLFIGETFPGQVPGVINTPMTYKSIQNNTVIGN